MSYTLVFDGNHFLHKTLHVASRIKESFSRVPMDFKGDPDTDRNVLLHKLATDFVSEVKKFSPVADQVVYCIDSQSWRKLAFPLESYKGHRKKESSISWDLVFAAHEQFVSSIAKQGVHISRAYGAEGDDLIFNWSNHLNHWGDRNCIIISGDNDLLQLVSRDDSSGRFTIFHNKFDKQLKVFPGFEAWLSEQSEAGTLFDPGTSFIKDDREDLALIIKQSGIELDRINSTEYIFVKILIGDSGDNVPPVYQRKKQTKKGELTYRFSEKMARTVLDRFKTASSIVYVNQFHLFDETSISKICSLAMEEMSVDDKLIEEIIERWKINRDMLYLHRDCIPSYVIDNMSKDYESGKQSRHNKAMTREQILADTDWFDWQQVGGQIKTNGEPDVVIKDSPKGGFDANRWKKFR